MFFNKFILASKSKSRIFILRKNQLKFTLSTPKCDEKKIKKQKIKENISPKKLSLILAKNKAKSVSIKNKQLVVGSDTVIEFEGKVLSKATNMKGAKKKIKMLLGKKHHIYSSAAAYYKNKLIWRATQTTIVKLRKLTEKETNIYLKKSGKDILHSVGCYQIEKNGPNIIENIKGDFFNVMGFPLFPFLKFLKKLNIKK